MVGLARPLCRETDLAVPPNNRPEIDRDQVSRETCPRAELTKVVSHEEQRRRLLIPVCWKLIAVRDPGCGTRFTARSDGVVVDLGQRSEDCLGIGAKSPQVGRVSTVQSSVSSLRGDIADAAGRMRVTFGTRTAMKNLVYSLESGEQAKEMVACTFAGSDGLLVLTDRRIIAIRDDYSRFLLRDCALSEITCVDYAPTVHDGLAFFTESGRVAVRKMNTEDSDRLIGVLHGMIPTLVVTPLAPGSYVRAPGGPIRRAGGSGTGANVAQHAPSTPSAAAVPAAAAPAAATGIAGLDPNLLTSLPPAPATIVMSGPQASSIPTAAPGPPAETDVLLGVLADLHARGLLSSDELAAKIALLAIAHDSGYLGTPS